MNTLKTKLKRLIKRNRLILRVYNLYLYLHITSPTELFYVLKNVGRLKLISEVIYYTQITHRRLITLHQLASRCEKRKISGSFIECGVRNGGSAAIIAAAGRKNAERHVWLFDSWEGLPEPDEKDIAGNPEEAKKGLGLGYEEKVKELIFGRLKLDNTRIHLVKGWFSDTLPVTDTGKIALLHLDCDLYQSVKYCLETLYDNIVEGGCVVIDDYGYWKGSNEAVDEFIKNRNLNVNLVRIKSQGAYFFKKSTDVGR